MSLFLIRTPEQCPSVVSLLSESYNPHVRYGAAMALGICCAGTGNKVKPKARQAALSWRQTVFPSRKVYVTAVKIQVCYNLYLPRKLSFPELPHFTVPDCWKRFKNKPHYMGGSSRNNAVEFFEKCWFL